MFRDLSPLYIYMRRYRWGYLWGTLSCIATNAAAVQFPRVLGWAIDKLQNHQANHQLILLFAGLLVAISLTKGIFLYSQRWILIGISRDIEFDIRNDLFLHLEKQDTGFYHRYRTGDVMARMTNDLNAVRMLLGPALMYSANTVFFTVFALYFLLRISPWLTLVAWRPCRSPASLCSTSEAGFTTASSASRPASPRSARRPRRTTPASRLIRAFAREESQIGLFERLNRQYIARSLRLVQLMGMLWPTLEFILGISMVITLLAGGHLVIAHRITSASSSPSTPTWCCSSGPSSRWAGW